MKNCATMLATFALVACFSILAPAQGFEPFDACSLDPNSETKLFYRQLTFHREASMTVCDEELGPVLSTGTRDVTLAYIGSAIKIVKDSFIANYHTNEFIEDSFISEDGPYLEGNILPDDFFKYGCGQYYNSWNDPDATILNRYLNGEDISDAAGTGYDLEVLESHSSTGYSVTFTITNIDPENEDDCGSGTITWTASLDGGFTPGKEVNDGKDKGQDCDCEGMPRWFVTEPYLNLWIKDKPVFYTTSLGERVEFEIMYKQRDTRPSDPEVTSVPITGWQHNWFSYFSFQVPTILSGTNGNGYAVAGTSSRGAVMRANWVLTNDFSQWSAILYAPDGGENYFNHNFTTEADSGLKVLPLDGSGAGFRVVHSDGSQDVYATITGLRPIYGHTLQRGTPKPIKGSSASGVDVDTHYTGASSTNSYSEFDNSADASPPFGAVVGYMAGEALLSARIDPYGNAIYLTYDASNRVETITDYDGKVTEFDYEDGMLTQVNMPYDRSASFGYTNGLLYRMTDAEGMTSYVSYAASLYTHSMAFGTNRHGTNIVASTLTTPYGTTLFEHTEAEYYVTVDNPPSLQMVTGTWGTSTSYTTNAGTGTIKVYVGRAGGTNRVNRAWRITNPDSSKELYVYRYDSTNLVPASYVSGQIPSSAAISGMDDGQSQQGMDSLLTTRNSFYWDRQQSTLIGSLSLNNISAGAAALARMSHWLASSDEAGTLSESVSLVRAPSPDGTVEGAKTWFDYSGKPASWRASGGMGAVVAARVMPDDTIAYQRTSYNNSGLLGSIAETYSLSDGSISERTYSFGYEAATVSSGLGSYQYDRLSSVYWPGGGSITRYFSEDGLRMDQVDSLGYSNTVFFNSRHQVTGIKRANGLTTTNYYDATSGFLSKRIDLQTGASNTYTFANGLLKTNINPLGLITSYTWDMLERPLTVTFPDSTKIERKYDKLNLVAHKDRLGKWSTAGYDSMGQLTTLTNANTNITQYVWCYCGALESVTDPANQTTTFTRNNNGHVLSAVSGGFTTTYNRDLFGQVTNVTSSAGLDLDYHYNIQGLVTNVSNPAGTVFEAIYDAADRPVYLTDDRGVTIANSFDSLGRLWQRQDELWNSEYFFYSAQGMTEHYDPLSQVTRYGYDPAGRLASITNANLEVTQLGYNPVGQLTSLTDGRNHTKRWAFDLYGRQTAETNAAGVLVRTNGYDANGRVTSVWTAAKGKSFFGYDHSGNLKTVSHPNSGTLNYTYDTLDRLKTMSDAVGGTTFGYTGFGAFRGALSSEDGPWSSDTVSYGYTSRKLTSIGLGGWSQSFDYDAALRPEEITSPAGTFTYAFNGAGRQVGKLTFPSSTQNTVTNFYDEVGALKLTQMKKSSTVLESRGYTINAAGLITGLTRLNGVTASYGYDPVGQLVSAQAFESGPVPRLNEQFGYGYDESHNLALRTNNTLLQTFTSNAKNELVNVVREGTLTVAGSVTGAVATLGVNGTAAEIYSDKTFATTIGLTLQDGNNLFVTAGSNAAGTLVLSTAEARKLPVTVGFAYDLNGNLLSDGLKGYEYDDANQLVRVTVTNQWRGEFGYDGLGRRRIAKDFTWGGASWTLTNEVRYVWDGMAVEAGKIFLGDFAQASDVHVILKIGQLHAAGDGVGRGAFDKLFVGLAVMLGDAGQGIKNVRRKAFGGEFLRRPWSVFHDVVQDRDDLLIVGVHASHDAKRMEDVGFAGTVLPPAVGFNRDSDGFFQERHSAKVRETPNL